MTDDPATCAITQWTNRLEVNTRNGSVETSATLTILSEGVTLRTLLTDAMLNYRPGRRHWPTVAACAKTYQPVRLTHGKPDFRISLSQHLSSSCTRGSDYYPFEHSTLTNGMLQVSEGLLRRRYQKSVVGQWFHRRSREHRSIQPVISGELHPISCRPAADGFVAF